MSVCVRWDCQPSRWLACRNPQGLLLESLGQGWLLGAQRRAFLWGPPTSLQAPPKESSCGSAHKTRHLEMVGGMILLDEDGVDDDDTLAPVGPGTQRRTHHQNQLPQVAFSFPCRAPSSGDQRRI